MHIRLTNRFYITGTRLSSSWAVSLWDAQNPAWSIANGFAKTREDAKSWATEILSERELA